jgi:hypothetical protein
VTNVINGSAKAWVNFNGEGTLAIRASFNVASVTDLGTGYYRINFTNAMEDDNYSVAAMINSAAASYLVLPVFAGGGASTVSPTNNARSTYLTASNFTVAMTAAHSWNSQQDTEDSCFVVFR